MRRQLDLRQIYLPLREIILLERQGHFRQGLAPRLGAAATRTGSLRHLDFVFQLCFFFVARYFRVPACGGVGLGG